MKSLNILDIKSFMSKLLISDAFDRFLFLEATIVTANTYRIDGRINEEFYSSEELEEIYDKLNVWSKAKHICFEIIKGKKLPLSFKIVLQLSGKNVEKFLEQINIGYSSDDINGLFINISFDREGLKCISGTSLKIFTMDKAIDNEWDIAVKRFMKINEIAFEEN